jgi:hypothetical protein
MNYYSLLMCTVVLASLITFVSAENDPLSDSSTTASATKEELKSTMQSDIFNVGHNGMSNSTSASASKLTQVVITRTSQSTMTSSKTATRALSTKVSGNWHLVLTDSVRRSVNLFLSQNGDVIYGTGNMTSGNITQQAAAFGTIAATQLSLKLISFTDFNLYQLTLDLKTPLINGDYKAVSPKANNTWTGSATGNITA